MNKYRYRKCIFFFVIVLLLSLRQGYSNVQSQNNPILIISSYNPETYRTSLNISQFLEKYKVLGGTCPVAIENMNCRSFSEAPAWKGLMHGILQKYTDERTPALIILLGQEAWSAYLSQDGIENKTTPVLCGMVSRNAVFLPSDTVDLEEWEPVSIDVEADYKYRASLSGYVYEYDVEGNIELIREMFPETKHIAFVSDNSYGGVSMRAYVKEEMRKFPELDLILLDGRQHTIYTIVDEITRLPEQTVLLVGTWRVDKNDAYFMRNATYMMMSAKPNLPAFTLASVGLGYWVVGGYVPTYRTIGDDLAKRAVAIIAGEAKEKEKLEVIPNEYVFDSKKLEEFHIDPKLIPAGAQIMNRDLTFFERYYYQILGIGGVFVLLVVGLLTTFYYYLRTKRLKDSLLLSESELIVAKERAEESDRLKSAFLANMSHEIRTPLNAIVGFSNVLVTGECSSEEQKEFVGVIQTNSDLLLRLIGDILDISRLETGRLKFNFESCDLVALCRNVLATTSYSKKEGVEYDFYSRYDSYLLETDIQRLQQILINLLSNANKFTESGKITLEFEVDEAHRMVQFAVSDTGCGIPKEKQEKVFERFEKLDEYAQGTGLGLAICRLTIERLGGRIWVDSKYEGGSRFVFTHPIAHRIHSGKDGKGNG